MFHSQVFAAGITEAWTLRISDLPGSRIMKAATVFDIAFSPNGQRLAVIAGAGRPGESTYLVILNTANPASEPQIIADDGPVGYGHMLSWSSPTRIAIPEVFQKLGQPGCILERQIHLEFYDANRLAEVKKAIIGRTIQSYDASCEPVSAFDVPGHWSLSDGSCDHRLLALTTTVAHQLQIALVDPAARKITRQWQLGDAWSSWPRFADSGNAICATDGVGKSGVAHCWEVDSGREIAKTTSGNMQDPLQTALYAKRAILSDYGWKFDFERWEIEAGSLRRRVLWDFGTGEELASWSPKRQLDTLGAKQPYTFALSPDGKMVAEGGSGEVTLSKVESRQDSVKRH
jgi:WD40 repeat protein